jgi:hypothetical protein
LITVFKFLAAKPGKRKQIAKKGIKPLRESVRNPQRLSHPKPKLHRKHTMREAEGLTKKAGNFTKSPISNKKRFEGSGPYSYDYLLGEDSFIDSPAEVVFVDYDIEEEVIQEWQNDGKMVICYVNVVRN